MTNDEHLDTLDQLATWYELSAKHFNRAAPTPIGQLHARRAAAIQWILAETAHGTDEGTPL